ncbi:hypothetical protein [Aedoeadaptatus coli]|uniref:hypothetical protein n=1 Tax=Aedoeadaptatus coli TaxID=2058292 RepID=UPI00131EF20A|nr:hypothetical protein [Peptoniphilus coli]
MKRYLLLFYDVSRFIIFSSILDDTDKFWLRLLCSILLVASAYDFIDHVKEVVRHEQA